jgi:hypothetical protein
MSETTFNAPATADFQGVRSISETAEREGFADATDYSARFAQALCRSGSLDLMRERFNALTSVACQLDPDKAAADEIGHHYMILEALFRKLVIQSVAATEFGGRGSSEAGERLLNGAFKAQRAAMACLSALKVLRDAAASKPPTTPAARAPVHASSGAGSSALSGPNELLLRHALD